MTFYYILGGFGIDFALAGVKIALSPGFNSSGLGKDMNYSNNPVITPKNDASQNLSCTYDLYLCDFGVFCEYLAISFVINTCTGLSCALIIFLKPFECPNIGL